MTQPPHWPIPGSSALEGQQMGDAFSGWEPVRPTTTRGQAEEWRFVLRAVNITSSIVSTIDHRVVLMVPYRDVRRAQRELAEYEQENRDRSTRRPIKDVPLYRRSLWALAMVASLSVFFSVTGPASEGSRWFRVGTANTNAILSGAVHQAVTALTLHSDIKHLLGNVMLGAILFAVLHRRFGPGLGSLVVLLSGFAGNLMNAAWHGTAHRSIGASTAIMGALGVLAASQLVMNRARRPTAKAVITWAPIVAGGALLGMFGASATSDLHAHGFGFLSGLILGLLFAYPLRHRDTPLPIWFNLLLGIATVGIVVAAWAVAFFVWPTSRA